jgi:nickel/cobalt exporter
MGSALSLLYLPSAFVFGALPALEPGHAKTLTATYLIAIRGTRRDACFLGLTITTTHTIVVLVLSIVSLLLGHPSAR